MTKLESLFLLGREGLNTPKLLGVVDSPKNQVRKITSKRVSVRTEKKDYFRCPHFPNVIYDEVKKEFPKLIKEGYSIYIFEALDPKDTTRRGNVMLSPDGTSFVFEWKDGPGTVRDLEDLIPETREYPGGIGVPEELRFPYIAMRRLGPTGQGMILEWSIYPYPVGAMDRQDIYWELRPWR